MRLDAQAAKYVSVGGAAFLIDYSLTWLAYPLLPLLLANTFGFAIANLFNFLAAHRWVFDARFDRTDLTSLYLQVLAVSVVGLAINNAIIWVLVGQLAWALIAGKIIATGVGLLWNFAARKYWVYRS
jgi:putative flippase GtrA